MPWWVKDPEEHEEESLGRFFEDYEMADALAYFFKVVSTRETATLRWTY
jgi:hypothetical protein